MNRFFGALLLVFCCAAARVSAAEDPLPAGWTEDYPAAVARAEKENKVLLLLFTGSDWCPWCQKLKKDVLLTKAFRELDGKTVPVYLDFPAHRNVSAKIKAQNNALQKQFNVNGFPTTVVATPAGRELTRISGYRPAPEFVKLVEGAWAK